MLKNISNLAATLSDKLVSSSDSSLDAGSLKNRRLHIAALCLLAALAPACFQAGDESAMGEEDEVTADEAMADVGEEDGENIGAAASAISATGTLYTLPYRGGGGGSFFGINCPTGYVGVGIYGRSASWLDQLGLICAPLNANGTLGATYFAGSKGGNGGNYFVRTCGAGQALVGFQYKWGNYVDRIDLWCASPTTWVGPFPYSSFVTGAGGTGGDHQAYDPCPAGYFVTSLFGRSDAYVDGVQPQCRKYVP